MKQRILITDKVHPFLIEHLKTTGYEVHYDTTVTMDTLPEIITNYQGIVINSKIKMNKPLLDLSRNLSFIARLGSGMEIVDIPYARSLGIRVINSPEGNCDSVGEHLIGMLLMLANNLGRSDREVKQMVWDREGNRGWELMNKTIGIIGVGHTGMATARKLSGFQINILGYDKYKTGYAQGMLKFQESTLQEIQEKADIISFHLPLREDTRYLCDASFLNACKDGVVIVNTSRGNVVKTSDLIDALVSGKVAGACLDVFENEKPNNYTTSERKMYNRLYSFDQVVVSPHIAGWTRESLLRIAEIVYERIIGNYTMEG